MSFKILVNNIEIEAFDGETILSALRRNGVDVPTLCYMKGFTPTGACRLCVVEVEGVPDLVTSCSYPVKEGMKITTNSLEVIDARKSLVELLLSSHPDDCLYCVRNGNCELQKLAEQLGIKERKFFSRKKPDHPDHSSPSIYRDPAKCILCSRCVRVCEEDQYVTAIDFIGKGNKTKVNSAFNKGLNVSSCINCGQCVTVCPTGALSDISHVEKVQAAIGDEKNYVTAIISSASIASFAEMMKLKPNDNVKGKLIAALKKIGFSRSVMLSSAIELNLGLDAQFVAENINSNNNTTVFSSCCPGWVKFVEEFKPDLVKYLSPVKSPQQLMGHLLKSKDKNPGNKYNVAVMPCTAKKFEAQREEMIRKGISDIDAVLTIRELVDFIKKYGIDFYNLPQVEEDNYMQQLSPASFKVGYAGGKAEEVAKRVFDIFNDNKGEKFKFVVPKNGKTKKETILEVGGNKIGFAWVSGIVNAVNFIERIDIENDESMRYVEVMACPGGCVGGGGNNISFFEENMKSKRKMCVEMEKLLTKNDSKPLKPETILRDYFETDNDNNDINKLYTSYKSR